MNKKDMKKYKEALLKKREELSGEIHDIVKENLKSQKEASGDLSSYSLHMADMASDSYDRELSLNIATNEQEVIYEIDEALKRIEEGKYGLCLSCEKKIPVKRLKALPYVKNCIECQSKEDKNNGKH